MRQIAISGGTGYVGQFIVNDLLAAGYKVVVLGRNAPRDGAFVAPVDYRFASLVDTEQGADLFFNCDAFVHCAFHHEPRKYRGGEGDNPRQFQTLNHTGSMALFRAAKLAGVKRAVFLSSRAVYGNQSAGVVLTENSDPQPDTLYGKVKRDTELALAALNDDDFLTIVLRATGVYGPMHGSSWHKWSEFFEAFDKGQAIPPRIGTEVHGDDLADAVRLLLMCESAEIRKVVGGDKTPIFNVSDILLDRRDLLENYARLTNSARCQFLERVLGAHFNIMDCSLLERLGWKPRGRLDLSWILSPKPIQ